MKPATPLRLLLHAGLLLGCLLHAMADPASPARPAWRFLEIDARSLALHDGDRPVLVYNHGILLKPGVPADRARGSYIHPLHGIDGEVLTDDFPEDHHHHRGLFWAWPHVASGGRQFDSWMLKGMENRWESWGARQANAAAAVLEVRNAWFAGTERIMTEFLRLTVHPVADDSRAIDLEFTWTPVAAAIRLAGAEGKSYGGLTLRYAPGTNTVITTPEGVSRDDLYITRLPWADLSRRWDSGARQGQVSGAALFIDPAHPDFPPTWLTRHYGVLCIGWPGVEGGTFAPGQTLRCRYRVWVHRGPASLERLRSAYQDYAGPARGVSPP